MKKEKRFLPYITATLASVIFGFSFVFTKDALSIMSTLQIIAYRFALAAILLNILKILGFIKIDFKGKKIGSLLLLSLVQPVAYFTCETIGVNLTSASEAGMMIALVPVIVTVFAAVFLKEKPSAVQLIFIVVSVIGVMFTIFGKGSIGAKFNYLGILALFGAVLSAALYNILSRRSSIHFKPVEITYVMMTVAAVLFNILAIGEGAIKGNIMGYFKPLFNINSWVAILYLGILSSVLAFFMLNYTFSKLPASQSAVFANLTTIISIFAGVFFRNESFYWFQAVGSALIILGVWGTNYYGGLANKSTSSQLPAAKNEVIY